MIYSKLRVCVLSLRIHASFIVGRLVLIVCGLVLIVGGLVLSVIGRLVLIVRRLDLIDSIRRMLIAWLDECLVVVTLRSVTDVGFL